MSIYIAEAGGPNNECPDFYPLELRLRGRWKTENVGHKDKGTNYMREVSRIAAIPGHRVYLDTQKKVGKILDGLADPKNAEVLERLRGLSQRYPNEGFGCEPTPEKVYTLDEDGVKTWLWVMAEIKQRGEMVEVAGSATIPSPEEVKQMAGGRWMPSVGTAREQKRVDVVDDDGDDEDGSDGDDGGSESYSGSSASGKKRGPGRPPKTGSGSGNGGGSGNSTSTTP